MKFIAAAIIFFLTWWLVLYLVLPWGHRGEKNKRGSHAEQAGAPKNPHLLLKFIVTSVISVIISAILYLLVI